MRIAVYICSLAITLVCIALSLEAGLRHFLPDAYRGYLIEQDSGTVTWTIGPYEPAQPSSGFNAPVSIQKPADTIRIVSLGTSGTEGWLTARTVYNKYGLPSEPKGLSSYSKSIEFVMNRIADPSSDKVEVINLGVAAYNITDVIRMLKASFKLEPDMLIVQIGGNETWTAERTKWSTHIDSDVPYLYSELGYELLTGLQGSWRTLTRGGNPFNPFALFSGKPRPVSPEPAGRTEVLQPRIDNYASELERLGKFLKRKGIPVLFLIPSQNIADYLPFGSMAKPGTSDEQLEKLNQFLLEALATPLPAAKDRYLGILALDDGIAEANFQLGQIYLQEGRRNKAREHFWRANDRDLVLKRLPGGFHDVSRRFVTENSLPYIDEMQFFESKSANGIVGYEWLDDDVHPGRHAQFDLGVEIVSKIVGSGMLGAGNYSANLNNMPTFDDYNEWTGFDKAAAGKLAFIRAAHNYIAFGRFRQRLQWDPKPERSLEAILADLKTANEYAPTDQSLGFAASLNAYLGNQDKAEQLLKLMDCRSSPERGTEVRKLVMNVVSPQLFGFTSPELNMTLQRLLDAEGCSE